MLLLAPTNAIDWGLKNVSRLRVTTNHLLHLFCNYWQNYLFLLNMFDAYTFLLLLIKILWCITELYLKIVAY